jgi:hypothetical protein
LLPSTELKRLSIPGKAKSVEEGAFAMTFIPTQTGFMRLEDSEKLLRVIFPNYPRLEPCHTAPALEAIAKRSGDGSN